jgi:hypothetical protein
VRWLIALASVGVSALAVAQEPAAEDTSAVDLLIERAYSEPAIQESARGWSLAIDNDLFGPTQSDRDYTGGLGITVSGPQTAGYWW